MKPMSPAEHERRLALYNQGLCDREIGEIIGVSFSSVHKWRIKHNIPARPEHRWRLTSEANAARRLLYDMRYSDRRIAKEQGVGCSKIQRWRQRRNLPPHDLSPTRWKHADLTRDTTLERIKRAIGRRLPRDIADDAVSDLYMAVLTGQVCLDKIEAEARKFGNRVLDRFASKFGPRSLDEELGDSDGFRMIDMIRDDRSSSWLEEMGATVW